MKMFHRFSLALLSGISLLALSAAAHAYSPQDVANVTSSGGTILGTRVVHVTNLNDSGTGSLRSAIASCGPCVVVFDVSGSISLKSDLTIEKPFVTIAGETAPSPGVILLNGTLKVRASDVVLSHIGVYPGSSTNPKIAENRDGISIYGSSSSEALHGIVLRNVSIGWGVDENLGIQGKTDGVRIERSLIAQPLRNGGHPKGVHSMNLLLGNTVKRVIILGSVLAASEQRSPRLTSGNRVSFLNNMIVAPGAIPSHLDTSEEIFQDGAIDMIGNSYFSAPFTYCKRKAIEIAPTFLQSTPKTSVYIRDNVVNNDAKKNCLVLPDEKTPGLFISHRANVSAWKLIPGSAVRDAIPQFAGSHPRNRNIIDAAVMTKIKANNLTLLNNEKDLPFSPVFVGPKAVSIPATITQVKTAADLTDLQKRLCVLYKSATGMTSCPK